jgi:hypothetical protein
MHRLQLLLLHDNVDDVEDATIADTGTPNNHRWCLTAAGNVQIVWRTDWLRRKISRQRKGMGDNDGADNHGKGHRGRTRLCRQPWMDKTLPATQDEDFINDLNVRWRRRPRLSRVGKT